MIDGMICLILKLEIDEITYEVLIDHSELTTCLSCSFQQDTSQGSHSTWKTWKNDKSFSSHGNIMEF